MTSKSRLGGEFDLFQYVSTETAVNISQIEIKRAFTTTSAESGNKAGVCILERFSLTQKEMQDLAYEVGLSETAFLVYSNGTVHFKFFTSTSEVDNCGHATVASIGALVDKGVLKDGSYQTKTNLGLGKVKIAESKVSLKLIGMNFSEFREQKSVLKSISLSQDAVDLSLPFARSSVGVPFIVVPVMKSSLENVSLNKELMNEISKESDIVGVYLYAKDDMRKDGFATRMFAPAIGIEEESATGMASGALIHALENSGAINSNKILVRQGEYMNPASPSDLFVEIDFVEKNSYWVGGFWV